MSSKWSQLNPIQQKRALNILLQDPVVKSALITAFNNDQNHFSTGSSGEDAVNAIYTTIQTMLNATTSDLYTQTKQAKKVMLIISSQTPLSTIAIIQFMIPYLVNGIFVDILMGQTTVDAGDNLLGGIAAIIKVFQDNFFSQSSTDLRNANSKIPTQYQIPSIVVPVTTSIVVGSDEADLKVKLIEKIQNEKNNILSIHLVGPKQSFLTPLNNIMIKLAPEIIITSTQPAPSVIVIPEPRSSTEENKIKDTTITTTPFNLITLSQQLATNITSQLDPNNHLYHQISRHNIIYIEAPAYKEFVRQLAIDIKLSLTSLTTPKLTPQQQSSTTQILQTAQEHYLFQDDEGVDNIEGIGDVNKAIVKINDVVNIIKTNHWASLDLTPLNNTPTVLCIPYRNNLELINFLATSVTTHGCAVFGENLSEVYEIIHHPKVIMNNISINTLYPSTITSNSTTVVLEPSFAPQLLSGVNNNAVIGRSDNGIKIFTQNKETGLYNPFIPLDSNFRTQHHSLSSTMSVPKDAVELQQGPVLPTVTKHKPTSFPIIPTIPTTSSSLSTPSASKTGIDATIKQYINGKQCRSEGEYSLTIPLKNTTTTAMNNTLILPAATRKDLRDAVEAAQSSHAGWIKTAGSLRLQIMLYLAENLMARYATVIPTEKLQIINEIIFHSSQYCDKFGGIVYPTVNGNNNQEGNNKLFTPKLQANINDNTYKLTQWTELPLSLTVPNDVNELDTFKYTLYRPQGVVVLRLPTNIDFVSFLSILIPLLVRGNTVIVLFHIVAMDNNGENNTDLMTIELITQFYQVLETTGLNAVSILFTTGCWDDEATTNALKHLDIDQFVTVIDNGNDYSYAKQFLNLSLKNNIIMTTQKIKEQFVYDNTDSKSIVGLNNSIFHQNVHYLISASTTTRDVTIKRW